MKTIVKSIIASLFIVNSSFAFHDVEVANEEIAVLGGVWTQIFAYEEYCFDNQYFDTVIDRLMISPRFERYSSESDHLNEGRNWLGKEVQSVPQLLLKQDKQIVT